MTSPKHSRLVTPPPRSYNCPGAPRSKPAIETSPLFRLQPVDFAFGASSEEWLDSCATNGGNGRSRGGSGSGSGSGSDGDAVGGAGGLGHSSWASSSAATTCSGSNEADKLALGGDIRWNDSADGGGGGGGSWDEWLDKVLESCAQGELMAMAPHDDHGGTPSRKRRRPMGSW